MSHAVCPSSQKADAGAADLSARVAGLREQALAYADDPDPTERGWAVMKSYDETMAEPMPIRRAKAATAFLRAQTLTLDEGDLIAGRLRRQVAVHPGIHEGHRWASAAAYPDVSPNLDALQRGPVPRDFVDYMARWVKRHPNVFAKARALTPPPTRRAMAVKAFTGSGVDMGHRLPRFELLLAKGAVGIRQEAQEHLAQLDATRADSVGKGSFYQSIIIVCDGMIDYGERWAEHLDARAARETDSGRRAELEHMAGVCRRVPALPATTFREAVQSTWFGLCANQAESTGTAGSFGRLDQYLWPYYQADLAAGRLTRGDAIELIECLFLKCYRTFDFHHTMLAGLTPDGRDGTNELSYLGLDAVAALRTPRDLAVRIHSKTPPEFMRRAAEVARLGLGRPDFWNDEVMVPALVDAGFPIEDARDYAAIGCVEITIPGKCNSRTMGHAVSLGKILEITLNGGRCALTGEVVGLVDDTDFATYEDLHRAYRRQAKRFIRMAIEEDVRGYVVQSTEHPFPVLSAFTVGCMESGCDVMAGGAQYNPAGVNLHGVADVADSLAAIKKLVYEERALSLADLTEALKSNFEGRESLRQMLIARAPKFGNDEPYVDAIAVEEAEFYCDEVAQYPTPEGGKHLALLFGTTPSSAYSMGPATGALPDGRRAGEPLATSVNPTHGRALAGVTAELNSVARINGRKAPGGVSYIVDLHPTAVRGDTGLDKLVTLLTTFFEQGGVEVGLNVLSEDELRAAQTDPDSYAHIMVRVFGFSTHFVSLDPELQDMVISKVQHES